MLATGRESFSRAAARAHVDRLKEAAAWITALRRWRLGLEMWEAPWNNVVVAAAAYCLCFHTSLSLLAYFAYRWVGRGWGACL